MTIKGLISALTEQEDLNFLLTNRIPRAAVTRFMGWFSKIENPLVRDLSIACWRLFSELDLSEAKKTEFRSLHDCFTRELRPGLRPPDGDPQVVVSPSDGIIGAHGTIRDGELYQIKGAPYSLLDLLGDGALVEQHKNGRFITLRLTSSTRSCCISLISSSMRRPKGRSTLLLTSASARATSSAGSSMDRPSSCSRRIISNSATA